MAKRDTVPSIVTFTTDFGARDWFAGALEGVVSTISPVTKVVTITHEIPAQDIRAGAFALAAAYNYFPKATIHVAIVDPGVGGARKPIAARTTNYIFIGPDNGLLSWALRRESVLEIRELKNPRLFLSNVSQTFHGRDVFAPVAAHLARGVSFAAVGPRLRKMLKLPWPDPITDSGMTRGEIIYIDRYGNCITNIPAARVSADCTSILIGRRSIPIKKSYAAVGAGAPLCVAGSHGYLELAVNGGSAERVLSAKVGSAVRLDESG